MHFEAMASFLSVILRCLSDDAEQPRSRASNSGFACLLRGRPLVMENARGRATNAAIVRVASSILSESVGARGELAPVRAPLQNRPTWTCVLGLASNCDHVTYVVAERFRFNLSTGAMTEHRKRHFALRTLPMQRVLLRSKRCKTCVQGGLRVPIAESRNVRVRCPSTKTGGKSGS